MKDQKRLMRRRALPDLFPAPIAGAAAQSVELSVFADQRSRANTNTGHGEMAEEAITILNTLGGLDAEVTGRDNAKDGPDRRVGDVFIQTKYYNSARDSMEAAFDEETGLYRYFRDGKPMQLEVPADQYDRVVTLLAEKIEAGLIPGVTDPGAAADIARPGILTYQQAVDLTRPMTAASLAYDAATGALVSICAMGLSFSAAAVSALFRTRSVKKSLSAGAAAGAQGLGRAFAQHLLISQLARTEFAASVLPAAESAVDPLSGAAINAAANALRSLNGKAAIAGATAEKQLARMLRTGLLSSALIFILLTLPDGFRLASRRISCAQFAKNLLCRLASLTGGTLGAIGAGMLLGPAAAPALGTLISMIGAFLGGTALAWGIGALFSLFREDDSTRAVRLLNNAALSLCAEYGLNADETAALSTRLRRIPARQLRRALMQLHRNRHQESAMYDFLRPHFAAVIQARPSAAPRQMSLEMPDIG